MAKKRRRRAVAIPRALDCIKPEHRDGYARYLATRPAFEIKMFLEKLYANDSKRRHFLYPPRVVQVTLDPTPLTHVDHTNRPDNTDMAEMDEDMGIPFRGKDVTKKQKPTDFKQSTRSQKPSTVSQTSREAEQPWFNYL